MHTKEKKTTLKGMFSVSIVCLRKTKDRRIDKGISAVQGYIPFFPYFPSFPKWQKDCLFKRRRF